MQCALGFCEEWRPGFGVRALLRELYSTLARNPDGKYIFPFGEDLEELLEPNQPEKNLEDVDAKLARQNGR